MTDLFDEKAIDRDLAIKECILPGILDSNICSPYNDGRIYLAPYNYGVMGLWYNKDFFKRKGIAPPETWEEFFALNETAIERKEGHYLPIRGFIPPIMKRLCCLHLYSAGGSECVDKYFNYSEGLWKSEAAQKVLGLFERIAVGDMLMKGTVALNHTQAQTEFMKGKAMFIINGSWFEGEMKDAPREAGFEFGFLGVPSFHKGDPMTCLVNPETLMIPAKAKNPELAKEFLKYIYTDKIIKLNGEKAKAVMAVEGAVELVKDSITPSSYECFKSVENGKLPVMGSFKQLAKGSKTNVTDEIYKPLSGVMNKQLTAAQWGDKLDSVYAKIRRELAEQ